MDLHFIHGVSLARPLLCPPPCCVILQPIRSLSARFALFFISRDRARNQAGRPVLFHNAHIRLMTNGNDLPLKSRQTPVVAGTHVVAGHAGVVPAR